MSIHLQPVKHQNNVDRNTLSTYQQTLYKITKLQCDKKSVLCICLPVVCRNNKDFYLLLVRF